MALSRHKGESTSASCTTTHGIPGLVNRGVSGQSATGTAQAPTSKRWSQSEFLNFRFVPTWKALDPTSIVSGMERQNGKGPHRVHMCAGAPVCRCYGPLA